MKDLPIRQLKIVSGGQTGVDRAALDFAIQQGIPHGGWCPRGRRAEDGPVPDNYALHETPSRNYKQRTKWNVRDSDATVLFTLESELVGGTKLTAEIAERLGKPWLHLCAAEQNAQEAGGELRRFLDQHEVAALNIAGPRASQELEVAKFVGAVLSSAFAAA